MQHHRGAGGKPALALGLGALAQDRRGQLVALHLGEVHTSLFKHPAAGHHPRTTAAALGPDPALFRKGGAAIEGLQAGADRILQTHQQGLGPLAGVGRGAFQGQLRAGAGVAWGRTGGGPAREAAHLGLGTGQQALQHQRHAPGALETTPPFQPTVPPHKPARRIVTPPGRQTPLRERSLGSGPCLAPPDGQPRSGTRSGPRCPSAPQGRRQRSLPGGAAMDRPGAPATESGRVSPGPAGLCHQPKGADC